MQLHAATAVNDGHYSEHDSYSHLEFIIYCEEDVDFFCVIRNKFLLK